MNTIKMNVSALQSGVTSETMTVFAFIASVNEKISKKRANIARLEGKEEQTDVVKTSIEKLKAEISELENQLKEPDVAGFTESYGSYTEAEDRLHIAIVASWFGGAWYNLNTDRLYDIFMGLLDGSTKNTEAKKALNSFLCVFRKPSTLLKGVKVSVNDKEVTTFKSIMLDGFKKDAKNGFVRLASINSNKFRKQLALYVLSIYQRADLKIIEAEEIPSEDEKKELDTLNVSGETLKENKPKQLKMVIAGTMKAGEAPKKSKPAKSKKSQKKAQTEPQQDTPAPQAE